MTPTRDTPTHDRIAPSIVLAILLIVVIVLSAIIGHGHSTLAMGV